jgi:hypothetical protein
VKIARVVFGCVVGVGVAFVLLLLADEAGQKLYPPADVDWSDAAAVKRYTDSLPLGVILLTLAGWIGPTFIGAAIGSASARSRAILISVVVGGLMLAAAIANFLITPYPWWLVVATIIGIVAATWIAAKYMWKPLAPTSSA